MSAAGRCRACGGTGLDVFYEVRSVPVHSCLLLVDRDAAGSFPRRDVVLAFCPGCGLVQNVVFDPAAVDYSADYEDSQAHSPRFVSFATELAGGLVDRYGLEGGRALEIGCGKGDFLAVLAGVGGMTGVGFDPAFRTGPLVAGAGDRVHFVREPYTAAHGHQGADLVVCRHTLEHVADVDAFVGELRRGLGGREDVVVFFEVPDVLRVLRDVAFWDVYYEHCSYFSIGSLARLFRRSGFDPVRAALGYDGQYVLLEARPHAGRGTAPVEGEDDLGALGGAVTAFAAAARERVAGLRSQLEELARRGPVVVWGAGSKAVGYLTTLGVAGEVDAVVDINPTKQGRFLAGTGHEIVAPSALARLAPGTVLLMNPIYAGEVARDLEGMGLDAAVVTP